MIKVLHIYSSLVVMSYLTNKENFNLQYMCKSQAQFIKSKKGNIFKDFEFTARVKIENLNEF